MKRRALPGLSITELGSPITFAKPRGGTGANVQFEFKGSDLNPTEERTGVSNVVPRRRYS